jgi:hypothetical protein
MAGRQRATFQKRQKEVKRLEKQRAKLEKRAARKMEKAQRATLVPSTHEGEPETHNSVEFLTSV